MVHMPQEREAKVQTLQQAVEQGSYHVPAEELAAKMLQDALQELLPELP
jgi:anti-sigma28 factor (negative regulator of flagellin synthesis)